MPYFDEAHYIAQKVEQMNATNYVGRTTPADGVWTAESAAAELAAWNLTWEQNFEACNGRNYDANITVQDINVSPNALFNVGEYAQALADYNNANSVGGQTNWTASSVIADVLNSGHQSLWSHYTTTGAALGINPSNAFDTMAWAEAQAASTGQSAADILSGLASRGQNPVQAYLDGGGSVDAAPAVPAADAVTVPGGFSPWGSGGSASDDPYDQDAIVQELTNAKDEYTGDAGQNTIFAANYGAQIANQTLQADDVIEGGADALNTLQVTLGQNWAGFNGVAATDAAGKATTAANVTGVGRLVLDHITTDTEYSYSFNAKNISGLEQIDINNGAKDTDGGGTIQLTELQNTVKTINISGWSNASGSDEAPLDAKKAGNIFSFAKGQLDGDNDALTLGLNNVGKSGGRAIISTTGIENLTVDAKTGSSNTIDISGFKGLNTLTVTGDGDLDVLAPKSGVTSYDASAAKGDVNFHAGSLKAATVVKGGSGHDTLTLTTGSNNFTPTEWSGIESLAIDRGASCNINATNVSDLTDIWVVNTAGNVKLSNWTAKSVNINQVDTSANIQAKGSIGDVVYSTQGGVADPSVGTVNARGGALVTDATGNITINVNPNTYYEGTFTANDAKGDVVLNLLAPSADADEDSSAGSLSSATIAAKAAKTFTANLNGGNMGGDNTFDVVQGKPVQGSAVTFKGNLASDGNTTTLNAKGASEATFELTANLGEKATKDTYTWTGDIDGAQNITIALNYVPETNSAYTLDMKDLSMGGAQNVTVTGTEAEDEDGKGQTVVLGSLGNKTNNASINLQANTLEAFTVGDILVGNGWNIDANISTVGDITIGNIAAASTKASNTMGDVNITLATESGDVVFKAGTEETPGTPEGDETAGDEESSGWSIKGDDIKVDISGVAGAIPEVELTAKSTLNYTGNSTADVITVAGVGKGTSTIDLGGDTDLTGGGEAAVDTVTFKSITKNATVEVTNFGNGDDTVTFEAGSINTGVTLNISDLGEGKDTVSFKADAVKSGLVTLNLDFSDSDDEIDTLEVANNSNGKLLVNLDSFAKNDVVSGVETGFDFSGFDAEEPDADTQAQAKALAAVLKGFGISASRDVADYGTNSEIEGSFTYDGNTYLMVATGTDVTADNFQVGTLVCLSGDDAEIDVNTTA